jgi:hypothetical protein
LIRVKSPGSAGTDSDPEAAAVVRLPHRRRLSRILNWIALLILLGSAVAVLPVFVNGVAYLTRAESSSVVVLGVLVDGFCVLLLVFLVKLANGWGRHRPQGRHAGLRAPTPGPGPGQHQVSEAKRARS